MNKQELEEKIKNHQSEIGKLELAIKELDAPRYPFIPNVDEAYYVVSAYGHVVGLTRSIDHSSLHFQYLRVFRTRADAETWIKIQERINELEEVLETLDWDDEDQTKRVLTFDHEDVNFITHPNHVVQSQGATHMRASTTETIIEEFTMDELRVWACV